MKSVFGGRKSDRRDWRRADLEEVVVVEVGVDGG